MIAKVFAPNEDPDRLVPMLLSEESGEVILKYKVNRIYPWAFSPYSWLRHYDYHIKVRTEGGTILSTQVSKSKYDTFENGDEVTVQFWNTGPHVIWSHD